MTSTRWWHVAVLGTAVVLAAVLLVTSSSSVGFALLAAFVATWFAFGRLAFSKPWALRVYLPLLIAISAALCAVETSMALVQCVAFPLLWVLLASTRRAIAANFVLAAAITLGIWIGTGSVLVGVAIEVASLGFSLALGLWMTSIAHQSTERQRLLDELQATQARLSELSRDAGVSSERERLAREIHDTIAQDLTGLVMLTQQARQQLESGDVHLVDAQLALLEESARTALAETRALVASSAPVGLASAGIADALDRLGERFERETRIAVTVSADLPALERGTEVVLLRCAQEGLANVRKHSGARTASVTAFGHGGSVALRVEDDGDGFDPDAATDGFGLSGLRDRLALVGGSIDVSTSPAGTVLTATMPNLVPA